MGVEGLEPSRSIKANGFSFSIYLNKNYIDYKRTLSLSSSIKNSFTKILFIFSVYQIVFIILNIFLYCVL